MQPNNRIPCHNLPQYYGRIKYICKFCILYTYIFFKHNQRQVSGSINADPNNEKYTDKKLTKYVFGDEFEGDFISIKAINWCKQAWTLTQKTCHELPQPWRIIKSTWMVWIWTIYNFWPHPRTSIRINECWSDQPGQKSQQ